MCKSVSGCFERFHTSIGLTLWSFYHFHPFSTPNDFWCVGRLGASSPCAAGLPGTAEAVDPPADPLLAAAVWGFASRLPQAFPGLDELSPDPPAQDISL